MRIQLSARKRGMGKALRRILVGSQRKDGERGSAGTQECRNNPAGRIPLQTILVIPQCRPVMINAKAAPDDPVPTPSWIPGETGAGAEHVRQGVIKHMALLQHEAVIDLLVEVLTRPKMEVGEGRSGQWGGIAEVIPAQSVGQSQIVAYFPGILNKKTMRDQSIFVLAFC